MAEELTHWKILTNPKYLGAYEFKPGEEKIVQIVSVASEVVTGDGGKESQCTVAQLRDPVNKDNTIKPMILNATNCKTLKKLTGSDYIQKWAGARIILYVDPKVKLGKDIVEGLRIKREIPPLPELSKTGQYAAKWPGAVNALKTGQITIPILEKTFKISAENRELLISEAAE